MLRIYLFLILCIVSLGIFAQSAEYKDFSKQATEAYSHNHYREAAILFNKAFATLDGKGLQEDRYTAALCWAQVNEPDSAFYNLQKLADKTEFLDYNVLVNEPELNPLHTDLRWNKLLLQINPQNEVYNDSLANVLNEIYRLDQMYREQLDGIRVQYGQESKEMKELWHIISYQDSINLLKVENILDQYGWLSANEVGKTGNTTLWVVIQHADLPTQEKYYPLMKEAVQQHKASKSELAYLEDRILMRKGKKQLYGTQYKVDNKTGATVLWEVEDPKNLNKRRAEMGLPPMQEYRRLIRNWIALLNFVSLA